MQGTPYTITKAPAAPDFAHLRGCNKAVKLSTVNFIKSVEITGGGTPPKQATQSRGMGCGLSADFIFSSPLLIETMQDAGAGGLHKMSDRKGASPE